MPDTSLMPVVFEDVKNLASLILRQRKNPLRKDVILSKDLQEKEEKFLPQTNACSRSREIKSVQGPTKSTPAKSSGNTSHKRTAAALVEREQRTPDKRIYEKRSDVDWGKNRHRLRFPLERLLLWCNDFEEKQLKIIVDNSTHLPGAILETMVKIARILISSM
jgi:hypothetical protein